MSSINPIKFQKVIKDNHVEYHLPLTPHLMFFDEFTDNIKAWKENIMYPFGFTEKDLYDLEDDVLIYTMIIKYFSEDKNIALLHGFIKDIDEKLKPRDVYWNYCIHYTDYTRTPLCYVEGFEHYNGTQIVEIEKDTINHFSASYSDPVRSWNFILGADYDELLGQLNNQNRKPNIDTVLYIADYVITIQYGMEENYLSYILIQSKEEMDDKVNYLESLLSEFKEQYEVIMPLLDLDKPFDIELISKLKEVYEIRFVDEKIPYHLEEELGKIDWKKIKTTKGKDAKGISEAIKNISQGYDYQSLRQQLNGVEESSYYIIPFLQKIITLGNRNAKVFSYSLLWFVLLNSSESTEKVDYKGEKVTVEEGNYRAIFDGVEIYLEELEKGTDGEIAGFIWDIFDLFEEEDKKEFLDRLEQIKESNRDEENEEDKFKVIGDYQSSKERPKRYYGNSSSSSSSGYSDNSSITYYESCDYGGGCGE